MCFCQSSAELGHTCPATNISCLHFTVLLPQEAAVLRSEMKRLFRFLGLVFHPQLCEGNSYPLRTFPHFRGELTWNAPTDGGEIMSRAQLFLSELKWTSSIHLGLWAVPELMLLMPWLCCFWTPVSCSEEWVWQLGLKWLLLINNMEVYMSTCCAADISPSRNCTFKLVEFWRSEMFLWKALMDGENAEQHFFSACSSRNVNINKTTLREGVAWIIIIS